jgi:hypothetical protein
VENIPGYRDHHSGHYDHRSDDRDQLDRDHPGTSDRHHPGIMIAIIPEPVIGMPRNTDRHRPESPLDDRLRVILKGCREGDHC